MVNDDIHPLRRWRLDQEPKLTLDAAAALAGTVRAVWYGWESGRRIPDKTFMPRIYRITGGDVAPNHFYFPAGLPDLATAELPLEPSPAPLFEGLPREQENSGDAPEAKLQAA